LPGGDVLLVYSCPDVSGSVPCQLRVTAAGKIHQQKRLQVAYPLNTGFVYHRLDDNGVVHVFGNAQMNFNLPDNNTDFLAQFPLDGPTGTCLIWEPFEETAPNDIPVTLASATVTESNAPLNVLVRPIPLLQDFDLVAIEICSLSNIVAITRSDTLLPCEENWSVSLPDNRYVWEDGFPTSARSLTVPGTYRANKIACQDTLILEFHLEKQLCGCDVFLPNAISPNGDGLNDELRPFSNCAISEWKIAVYDRWGGRVFESDDQNQFWDGNTKGKTLTQGVYVAKINYKLVDRFGVVQAGELVQDFTVTK
jgi:gliding motility-associated-like protein